MQLDRTADFYKALGDVTRLQIIILLQQQALHGQALAGKLGVTPPTISHHMAKLREVGLIAERREKNTIYFSLNENSLVCHLREMMEIGKQKNKEVFAMTEAEQAKIIQHFFTPANTLKTIPAQRKKRLVVLAHLACGFERGRVYTEKEVSDYLKQFYDDYATLRRELIVCQFMHRRNGQYALNPSELWPI
ncbi:MAG: metalloregulator ArsR/SmtB family transcription factor [Sporolactobacillus sp.]